MQCYESRWAVAALEKMVENLPKVKNITFSCTPFASYISSKSFIELMKIPQFLTLDSLELCDIPEEFVLENFYTYMKKNKTTQISLFFADTISDDYKTVLESIIDEIIEDGKSDYKPPYIRFDGQDWGNFVKLRQIFLQR